nr:transportin 3 [Hymenolepis microstoma]
MEPTLETALQAIDALYVNPENSVKEGASKWLCEFQKSVYAWEIADKLLYLNRDLNSSYFGAQTIRIKGLKDSLLNHVKKITRETPKSIANQLCLALADLYCQMVHWKDGVTDIINGLSSNDVSSLYLLDILRFIAEEMNSKTLRLGLNRRHAIKSDLEQHKSLVSNFLVFKMKNADPLILSKIFKCLTSWWDHTGIMTGSDVRTELLEGAFYVLQHSDSCPEETCEDASDWIVSLVTFCPTISGYHTEMLSVLQVNIYALQEVFQRCCAQAAKALDESVAEGFVKRASLIVVIFAELTNTVRNSLIKKPSAPGSGEPGDLQTLDCLISVLEAPPPVCCIKNVLQTFQALDSLAENAVENGYHSNDQHKRISGDGPAAEEMNPRILLNSYYTRVVSVLTRLCVNDSDDLETADEVREFREDVYTIMISIVDLVGADVIFNELFNRIMQLQEMNNTGNTANLFREVEACLFMMTTMAKRLSSYDLEGRIATLITSFVLPGLASKPSPSMQEVVCILFNELAAWIVLHPEIRREIVEQLIQIIEGAANLTESNFDSGQKQVVCEALVALGKLCQSCRGRRTSSDKEPIPCDGLIDEQWNDLIFRVTYSIPRFARVPNTETQSFYEGVARALMATIAYLPKDGIDPRPGRLALPERLAQLLSVNIQCINKLMEQNQPIVPKDKNTDPAIWLDLIAAVFRTTAVLLSRLDDAYRRNKVVNSSSDIQVDQQGQAKEDSLSESAQTCLNGCLNVFISMVWPVLSRCLEMYSSKNHIMERCCRVIRFVVRTFSVNLRDALPEIANKLVQSYQQDQHSCFLYLTGVLTDVFGDLPECRPGLVSLFETLAPPTLNSLSGSLAEQPYVVEDLYRLCVRLVQRCATAFLSNPNVNIYALLNTALESLTLFTLNQISTESGEDSDVEKDGSSPVDSKKSDPKATQSATGAVAHFLQEVLTFTMEASEDTSSEILSGQELSQPRSESALAARRLMFWVLKPEEMCGGQRLTTTCIHSCCNGLSDDLFPEVSNLLLGLKMLIPRDLFSLWMDRTLEGLPIVRADGLVQATKQQLADFKEGVMVATRSHSITHALDAFVVLFR